MKEVTAIGWKSDCVMVEGDNGQSQKYTLKTAQLMQCTGFKDKNGVEIYDGDTVEYKQATGGILQPNPNVYVCKITWDDGDSGWSCRDTSPLTKGSFYYPKYTFVGSNMTVIKPVDNSK